MKSVPHKPAATRWRRLALPAVILLAAVALQGCGQNRSEPLSEAEGAGRVDHYPYSGSAHPSAFTYEYQVYVPKRHDPSKPWPLFVMVHGCGTTAEQQMHANQINDLADDEGFLVMYPDNGGTCWLATFSEPTAIHRGAGGEADVLAQMTQETMRNYNVDPERVYMIGMSAGAFQTTATAAAYPDIYAAVGVMAGGGYGMNAGCMVAVDALAPLYAPLAIAEMGDRARVIPFIAFGGTTDPLGEAPNPGGCSRMAFMEWMAINNMLSGAQPAGDAAAGRYSLDPSSTENSQVPNGYAWTKEVWRDTAGCEIGERWIVHGMGHYWSGGSSDPQWAAWTDSKGPSATKAAWDFFRRYRKSDTNNDCAESRP